MRLQNAAERIAARYIPQNSIMVAHQGGESVAVVYTYSAGARLAAIAYIGTSSKAAWHYSYRNAEQMQQKIESFFAGVSASRKFKAEYKAQREAEGHTFKAGDIVTNSWGYDQTNVDWYRVVKTTAHYVWLQPICAHVEETGFMSGESQPHIDTTSDDPKNWGVVAKEKGEVTKHKAYGQNVTMKYGSGSKWDGRKMYASWYA